MYLARLHRLAGQSNHDHVSVTNNLKKNQALSQRQRQATRTYNIINVYYADMMLLHEKQVNGAIGIDFSCDDNGRSLTEGVRTVAAVQATHGVTSFAPTVVTSPLEVYQRNLPAYTPQTGGRHGATALKLHLEGPVLSEAKRGAHRLSLLKPPDTRLEALYGEGVKYESTVGIITIAAELEVSPSPPPPHHHPPTHSHTVFHVANGIYIHVCFRRSKCGHD
jgi:N-acetylglucosamine-6-phosphate deacetylase